MTFEKGQSGNPDGRPKGLTDRRKIFSKYIKEDMPEMIEKAKQLAKEGDQQMLRLFLERFLPCVPKDELLPQGINLVKGSLSQEAQQVSDLIYNRELTPLEANTVIAHIEKKAGIKYKEDLEKELYEVKAELAALKANNN
jgi:hypothetical protein